MRHASRPGKAEAKWHSGAKQGDRDPRPTLFFHLRHPMGVVVVPRVVEVHGAPAVHPPERLTARALLAAGLVVRALVRDRLTKDLAAGAEGVAHRARALHETAGAIDAPFLPGPIDVTVLLVGGLVVRVEVQLDRCDTEVILTLRVRDEGPNALGCIAFLAVSLEQGHDGSGGLVTLLVGEKELAPGLPDATLRGCDGCPHQCLEKPLVRGDVRGGHVVERLLHGAAVHVAKLAFLGKARVARAGPGGSAWFDIVLRAVVWARDPLPLHQLPQLLVREETALRQLQRPQEAARLVYERRVHLPHSRSSDLGQQAGIPLLLHSIEQGLLLREARELLLLRAPDDNRHLRAEVCADGNLRDGALAIRGHAAAQLQFVCVGDDAALPVWCCHKVHPLRASVCQDVAVAVCPWHGHLDPEGNRRPSADQDVTNDGARAAELRGRSLALREDRRKPGRAAVQLSLGQLDGHLRILHARGDGDGEVRSCDTTAAPQRPTAGRAAGNGGQADAAAAATSRLGRRGWRRCQRGGWGTIRRAAVLRARQDRTAEQPACRR
mmetsp:Transcript_7171/g.22423  ORF Transcript_7171/g.22423 Transcript_7171/m.22423 type:complete len:551 (-) Transcript_7171:111-1763(-)